MKEQKVKVKYLVGTMIEVPRGALTAGEIATEAQFFSFGTNDLTQMISASAAHGGDAASVHFFESVGLDYVSASPYRIPADAPPRGTTGRPHRSLEPRWI